VSFIRAFLSFTGLDRWQFNLFWIVPDCIIVTPCYLQLVRVSS